MRRMVLILGMLAGCGGGTPVPFAGDYDVTADTPASCSGVLNFGRVRIPTDDSQSFQVIYPVFDEGGITWTVIGEAGWTLEGEALHIDAFTHAWPASDPARQHWEVDAATFTHAADGTITGTWEITRVRTMPDDVATCAYDVVLTPVP